jgi:hypothetical protein
MGSKSAIGIGNGICFKQVRDKGGGSYIDPLVRDSIVGLWKSDQNTNESPTRNIIKNTIKGKGGDLELLNFGYKLNSGYGKYEEDFSLFILSNRFEYSEISNTKVTITAVLDNNTGIYHSVTEEDSALYWNTFKIKVSGSTDDVYISYVTNSKNIRLYNGINTVVVPNDLSWHSFTASATNVSCNITLEFVPEYEGALVTDGKDDMIVSQKTSLEMIGGDNRPFTVISMISVINNSRTYYNNMVGTTNMNLSVVNSTVLGKTGIFGYTSTELNTNPSVVNNILGDKNDYSTRLEGASSPVDRRFSVTGYLRDGTPTNVSSIAWYWTFIANKALTTDQINQVIAYFNLDRTLNPDILCDVKKQGITNDNHAEFGDKLIDFSGNGRDIQLNNIAWDGDSGIGKYNYPNWKVTATIANTYSTIVNYPTVNGTYSINVNGVSELMQSIGLHLEIKYTISTGVIYNDIKQDGVYSYILPDGATDLTLRFGGIPGIVNEPCNITITQIPSHAGALCLDGVSDFGKVTGMPIYKDYTLIADRYIENNVGSVASKSVDSNQYGAFIFEIGKNNFSFNTKSTGSTNLNKDRTISYLSKYSYNGENVNVGNEKDSDSLWLGTIRDNETSFSNIAIYSLMSFPYSMSEFLIERQLKKYKLGTLYPNMIEWRPIAKSNIPYKQIDYFIKRSGAYVRLNPGDYFQSTEDIIVRVTPIRDWQLDVVSSIKVNGKNEVISVNSSYAQTAPIISNILNL